MRNFDNGWGGTVRAMQYLGRVERFNSCFIEEPVGPDDIESLTPPAMLTRIPLATAEIAYGHWYHKPCLGMGAAATPQADATEWSGMTEWKPVADISAGDGVEVCPTGSTMRMRRWRPRHRMRPG